MAAEFSPLNSVGDTKVKSNAKGEMKVTWTAALAFRHVAGKHDHPSISRVASATGGSAAHVEIIFRVPCNTSRCLYSQGGVCDGKIPYHFVQYTVRDTTNARGVVMTIEPKLLKEGGWTIFAISENAGSPGTGAQRAKALQKFCASQLGGGYRPQCHYLCNMSMCKCCIDCCGCTPYGTTYADVAKWKAEESDEAPPRKRWFCSEFVTAALQYADILVAQLDPCRTTTADLLKEVETRPTVFTSTAMPKKIHTVDSDDDVDDDAVETVELSVTTPMNGTTAAASSSSVSSS
jgi:hypothetical protein